MSENPTSKRSKVADHMQLVVQVVLPLVTAIAGAAMFAYSQYYVGQVRLKTNQHYNTIEVHVYNQKGSELVFHTNRFQLAPGPYTFEVIIDQHPHLRYDEQVNFGQEIVLTCDVPPERTNDAASANGGAASSNRALPGSAAAKGAPQVKAATQAKPAAPAHVGAAPAMQSRAVAVEKKPVDTAAAVAHPRTATIEKKSVDPAAGRETEAVNLSIVGMSVRKLRNMPITADDPRLPPLLKELGAIQNAFSAPDTARATPLVLEFQKHVVDLETQLATSGPAPGVGPGAIRSLPQFHPIDRLVSDRLNDILGLDAPTRAGPFLDQRVRIVFRLRELEHQGADVKAQRQQYSQLDSYLSNLHQAIKAEDFARVSGEIKDLSRQLKIPSSLDN